MTCEQCGQPLAPGAAACPQCGRPAPMRTAPPPLQPPPMPGGPGVPVQAAPPSKAASALGITALILGILGICSGGLTAIVGLILGIIGIVLARRTPERTGLGISIGGTATSGAVLVLGVVMMTALWSIMPLGFRSNITKAFRPEFTNAVTEIQQAVEDFKTDTGVYPARLEDLSANGEDQLATEVPEGSYQGPYLSDAEGIGKTRIPRNSLLETPSDEVEKNWTYDPATGEVSPAIPPEWFDEGTTPEEGVHIEEMPAGSE